jgi:hypothetical protein
LRGTLEIRGKLARLSIGDAAIFSKKMTPAQIAEAQRLARDWKPGKIVRLRKFSQCACLALLIELFAS